MSAQFMGVYGCFYVCGVLAILGRNGADLAENDRIGGGFWVIFLARNSFVSAPEGVNPFVFGVVEEGGHG